MLGLDLDTNSILQSIMDNLSGDDSDWEDEFPLSTLRLLNVDDMGQADQTAMTTFPCAICATGTSSSAMTK